MNNYKEEIRERHLYKNGLSVSTGKIGQSIQKAAYDAMDEYAEQTSIEFAEWLQDNRWFHFDAQAQKWHYTFEQGTAISQKSYEKNYMKTSKELFQLFIKSKETK